MRGAALRALIVSRHLSLGFRQLTASVLPHRKTRGVSAYGQAWYIGDSPSRSFRMPALIAGRTAAAVFSLNRFVRKVASLI